MRVVVLLVPNVVALAVSAGPSARAPVIQAGGECVASQPTFGGVPGVWRESFVGTVEALAVFDGGGGSALHVGGNFAFAGGVKADHVARWDGESWSALGSGLDGSVRALAVFDDGSGSGPALYAGGTFTAAGSVVVDHVARWDGTAWSPVGSGLNGDVEALHVWDDGNGPALVAAGSFVRAGTVTVRHVAKWDGTTWAPLGSGLNDTVVALAVHGAELYAGGVFTRAGTTVVNRVARWDGASWAPLAGGTNDPVWSLASFDDGSGPMLYAGGSFTSAGGVAVNRVARWDGAAWSAVGTGVTSSTFAQVTAMSVFDDGSGPALHVGGRFSSAGGIAARNVARWDGSSWTALGGGISSFGGAVGETVEDLAVFDDGRGGGPGLFVGGAFTAVDGAGVGGIRCYGIARWSGTAWSLPGRGLNDSVLALAGYDDGQGDGPALFAAGTFDALDAAGPSRLARWDGASWDPLGPFESSSLNQSVSALAVYDSGGGPELVAGGSFESVRGVPASRVARWNGVRWAPLGAGIDGAVHALGVVDDGVAPALFAGGGFEVAGGVPANSIARWDGASWTPLGGGLTVGGGTFDSPPAVYALAAFDDGSGPALFAGGRFRFAGGIPVRHIAKWDGALWSDVGGGVTWAPVPDDASVRALTVFDDGAGPALYVGGFFTHAGGMEASYVIRWDGDRWTRLGDGPGSTAHALCVFDDGGGPALVAGGAFDTLAGAPAKYLARWRGGAWSPLGSGTSHGGFVDALAVVDGTLYAGGRFERALDSGDAYLARWVSDTVAPFLECPDRVVRHASGAGAVVTFSVAATDDCDPSPTITCTPPSGSLFPPGRTLVSCAAQDAAGNVSSCAFEVVVKNKIR